MEKKITEIPINTEFIKLDSMLKFAGAVESGGFAKSVIQEGLVKVNGEVCVQRGKKIFCGDTVQFNDLVFRVV